MDKIAHDERGLIVKLFLVDIRKLYKVCPGSSEPPEKILNILASENEVYTIF